MIEALRRSDCAAKSSGSSSSLEKSSSSFAGSLSASLTRTNSGLIRGEDGPAIELEDERLLEDMASGTKSFIHDMTDTTL